MVFNFPSPEPGPSPAPTQQVVSLAAEPAPESTQRPLFQCEDTCHGHSCDYWVSTIEKQTCATLESDEHCDCTACTCEKTYSCSNACSKTFPTCSCAATCEDDGNCCDDFHLSCSEDDFQAIIDQAGEEGDNLVAIVVGVGVTLLVAGAVGGFFVTRKILMNQRIARENILLKQGNANLDTGGVNYRSPKVVTGGRRSPNSEFSLL